MGNEHQRVREPRADRFRRRREPSARRAARAAVGRYHEAELRRLIERVRDVLARYDTGDIDAFELDDLIHHYKQATQKLWSFCVGSGGHVEMAARTLEWLRQGGERPDWWEEVATRRGRG